MINIQYLGSADIKINGISVLHSLSEKGAGLLFYLCGVEKSQFKREQIAMMFWPGYKKESSLSNLRFTLWKIRKVMKDYGLPEVIANEGKKYLSVDTDLVTTDINEYLECIKKDKCHNASLYYRGPFLEDFYLYDVPDFSDWVFNEREYFERTHYNTQLSLSKSYAEEGFIDKSTTILNDLINMDPLNESTYLTLITYLYQSGNKVAAINTYRNVKQLLRDELNVSPSKELQELVSAIIGDYHGAAVKEPSVPEVTAVTTSDHRLIFYATKDKDKLDLFASNLATFQTQPDHFIIDICDTPGYRVEYEGIFELLDDLEEKGHYNPKQWQNKYADIISNIRNKPIHSDFHLYRHIVDLLNGERSTTHVIRIWNLHWLDDKSVDFLSYLYRQQSMKTLIITGIVNESLLGPRVEAFLEAHESLSEFCLKHD